VYRVDFLQEALDELERLDRSVAQRLLKKLRWLAENFESAKAETLTGKLSGLFKLRLGDYRIVYEPDREHKAIIVHMVGHRREIYKRQ